MIVGNYCVCLCVVLRVSLRKHTEVSKKKKNLWVYFEMARGERKTCGVHVNIHWLYIDYCCDSVMNTQGYCSIPSVFCVYLKDHMIFTKITRGEEKSRESRKRRNKREGEEMGRRG